MRQAAVLSKEGRGTGEEALAHQVAQLAHGGGQRAQRAGLEAQPVQAGEAANLVG